MKIRKIVLIILCIAISCICVIWYLKCSKTEKDLNNKNTDAKKASIREMTKYADRIFVGKVTDTNIEKQMWTTIINNKKYNYEVKVNEISFKVEYAIKGTKEGSTITIKQLPSIGVPFEKDSEVLLYLAKNSKKGFAEPLGIYSGHFEITTHNGKKFATNLNNNIGLWSEDITPFKDTQGKIENYAATMKLPDDDRNEIIKMAEMMPTPGPKRLELIISYTKSCLDTD